jgi:Domain of unknown function (DUF5665)
MTKTPKRTNQEYEKMGRMLEDLYTYGKISTGRFVWMNFIRGVIYGFGLFIGGTIVVALVFWFLGQFNEAPLIGPIIQQIVEIARNTPTIPMN